MIRMFAAQSHPDPMSRMPLLAWSLKVRGQLKQIGQVEAVRSKGCQGMAALSFVCRACLTAWGCESPSHPDGGEVIAKRKGVVARRGLKAAWSKDASRWTRTGYEANDALPI